MVLPHRRCPDHNGAVFARALVAFDGSAGSRRALETLLRRSGRAPPGVRQLRPRRPSAEAGPDRKPGLRRQPQPPGRGGHTSTAEVIAATRRAEPAGLPTQVEEGTTCCYALQDAAGQGVATGPGGERWEVYTVLADAGGELEGTSPTSVPSPPPRPAAPLPPAHRQHVRSAAQAERASATDAAGGASRLRPAGGSEYRPNTAVRMRVRWYERVQV